MDDTPQLDPAVEAQVRALLAHSPDPGPMPEQVADRIEAALTQAAGLRVQPGPLATPGSPGSTDAASSPDGPRGGSVTPLAARRRRPHPLQLAAAVAAAVAVVAGGASLLHLTQRPNGAAVVGGGILSPTATQTSGSSGSAPGAPHIQLSTTAYSSANLGERARALIDHPGTPLPDLAAEAPHLGPMATPIGLESCLAALGVTNPGAVSADLATFEGHPAAIVVVSRDGAATAWAVERSCSPGQPGILKDATPVP